MAAPREQFQSNLGFILAAAGSAVGIGNLVGFPVNAAKNGGAAFLLVYGLFVLFICIPVIMAEMAAGRQSQRNPIGAYRSLSGGKTLWTIPGWSGVITPFMISVFYMVITVWVFGYLVEIVKGNLSLLADPDYFGSFINAKTIFVHMFFVAIMIGAILYQGVEKGIERAAKFMMPSLFIMLIGLVVFVLTLDNALTGAKFYLVPDFSKIDGKVINSALNQAFFSLSLGMGILITFGSYMSTKSSVPQSARMVALTDTGVAFCAGLLVLPAIFSFNPMTNADELSSSSVSLIFSLLPKIFLALQSSIGYFSASAVAAIFFLLVLFAALTSQVSIIQVPLSAIQDELKLSRPKSLLYFSVVAGVLCIFCTVSFGMVTFFTEFVSYAGQTKSFFDVVIDVFYDTILPFNGAFICLLVIFKWKLNGLNATLEQGDESYKDSFLQRYTNFSLSTFIPIVLFLVFANTVASKFFGYSFI